MEFRILGSLEVRSESGAVALGGIKPRAVVAMLLLHPNESVHPERLALALWGENAPASAAKTVQVYVARLRKALGDAEILETTPAGYRLRVRSDELDAERFARLVEDGRRALAAGHAEQAAAVLREALALWRGPPLADLAFEPFAQAEIAQLKGQRLAALEARVDADLAAGRHAVLVEEIQRLVADNPTRERLTGQLMIALYRCGRQADALDAYQRTRVQLANEFGLEPGPALKELQTQILEQAPSLQPVAEDRGSAAAAAKQAHEVAGPVEHPVIARPRSRDAVPNNLPAELTSFVGRRGELRQVSQALGHTRLLTLTGAGGCGKTRLALQAASNALDDHADGVWWIELARLEDPGLLPAGMMAAMGLREASGEAPLDTLVDHLRERGALLVLDNCEHLLAACAQLADALLRRCPSLTILATSRARLGVPGETAWRVPSMSLPDKTRRDPIEALAPSDAARLFADRATQVRPAFTITAANAPAIAEICHDLDGIPLAIELGAARARVLTPEQIADGLVDRFHLLTGGSHTVITRHQTLQASLEWSYELLNNGERTLLRRLSVFVGGWTVDAAEEICAGHMIDRHSVLDLLTGLYDNSLVTTHEQGSELRYGMLESVRQFAAGRLAEAGEVNDLRDGHLAYHAALAERSAPEVISAGGNDPVLRRLAAEVPNLHAALEWAAASDPQAALRLADALTLFWLLTGRYRVGDAAYARALDAAGDEPTTLRGRVLCGRASLGLNGEVLDEAPRWAQAALEIGRARGDLSVQARAYEALGITAVLGDDPTRGRALLERSLELACMAGDEWCRISAAQALGWCWNFQDDFDTARSLFDGVYEIVTRLGYRLGVAWHWLSLGRHAMLGGRLDESRRCFERCVAAAEEVGEPVTYGFAKTSIALICLCRGDAPDARALARQTLELAAETGAGRVVGRANDALGRTELALGELSAARRHLEAAVNAGGIAYHVAEQLAALGTVERIEGHAEAARARAEEALIVARRIGSGWLQAQAEGLLGRLALAEGDIREAERYVHTGLARLVAKRFALGMPECLDTLAAAAASQERFGEAARLLGAAAGGRARLGIVRWLPEPQFWSEVELATRETLGPDAYRAAFAAGAALDLHEAVAYARRARGARTRPKRGWDSLTPTELRVVELATEGLTNPQIAERMFISRATAKSHLSHIYAKTGISSRSELAAEAMRHALHAPRRIT